jgi:hypothetical protein
LDLSLNDGVTSLPVPKRLVEGGGGRGRRRREGKREREGRRRSTAEEGRQGEWEVEERTKKT